MNKKQRKQRRLAKRQKQKELRKKNLDAAQKAEKKAGEAGEKNGEAEEKSRENTEQSTLKQDQKPTNRDMLSVPQVNSPIHLYTYPTFKNTDIYKGMPEPSEDLPLAGSILLKVQFIDLPHILWGTDLTPEGEVKENVSRQYEFCLRQGSDFGIYFLYVKGRQNHFKSPHLKEFPLVHGGHTQRIPFLYSVLNQMSLEELWIIWRDLGGWKTEYLLSQLQ